MSDELNHLTALTQFMEAMELSALDQETEFQGVAVLDRPYSRCAATMVASIRGDEPSAPCRFGQRVVLGLYCAFEQISSAHHR